MTHKIGIDISALDYWHERTRQYVAGLDGPYHRHRLEVVRALMGDLSVAGKQVLDFGCGEGIFAAFLSEAGAQVTGLDIDATMIGLAQKRFPQGFAVGGVEKLAEFPDASFDALFALNVLAYMRPEEEATFYRESPRILKPGGSFVVTHSNELFDLYTLNKYTTAFFAQHFDVSVETLLTQPDKPERRTFAVRENPLAYAHKLARHGFREVRQEFVSLHPKPPLLIDNWQPDDINSREYRSTLGWPAEERWKLAFQCSMFGSHSIREVG